VFMVLNEKELEIVAISISVAAGCIPCTRYHIKEAGNLNATDVEIARAVRVGTDISDVAAGEMASIFDDGPAVDVGRVAEQANDRIPLLSIIGAAVARNSVSLFKASMKVRSAAGLDDSEIMEVVGLARRIIEKAASHIDPMVLNLDADPNIAKDAAQVCT
jgi:AhpD family alkylhydroperoxidase